MHCHSGAAFRRTDDYLAARSRRLSAARDGRTRSRPSHRLISQLRTSARLTRLGNHEPARNTALAVRERVDVLIADGQFDAVAAQPFIAALDAALGRDGRGPGGPGGPVGPGDLGDPGDPTDPTDPTDRTDPVDPDRCAYHRFVGDIAVFDSNATIYADSPIAHVEGSVRIRTYGTRELTLLPCLRVITSEIDATLSYSTRVFAGFDRLERVDKGIDIKCMEPVEPLPTFPRLIEAANVAIGFNPAVSAVPAIDAVRGFDALTTVGDSVAVLTPRVDGFASLVEVGGFLGLGRGFGWRFAHFGGFDSLTAVTGRLSISIATTEFVLPRFERLGSTGGVSLIDLPPHGDAFPALVTVAGSVNLMYDAPAAPHSAELGGFPALETIAGGIILRTQGHAAIDAAAFPALHEVGGSIEIAISPWLERIDGFGALTHAGGLEIRANPALTTIGGLGAMQTQSGELRIQGNTGERVSIDGFYELRTVSGGLAFGAAMVSIICPSQPHLESSPPPACFEPEGGGGLR